MASRVSISIRRQAALASIEASMSAIHGEEFQFPTQGRDPELLYAQQMEYIAEFLAAKAGERAETALDAMRAQQPIQTGARSGKQKGSR